jgi:hypothetical protein
MDVGPQAFTPAYPAQSRPSWHRNGRRCGVRRPNRPERRGPATVACAPCRSGPPNLPRRCGIDAPVEAENAARVVGLQALGLRRRGQHQKLRRSAAEEDQQRDRSLGRTQNGPVGGAGALQAGMNHVLRAVRLVGLRNQAAAPVEQLLKPGRQFGKRTDRQMADEVRSRTPADNDLAGFGELVRLLLLGRDERTGTEQPAQQQTFHSRTIPIHQFHLEPVCGLISSQRKPVSTRMTARTISATKAVAYKE